jgi:hypothetical protein
MCVRTEIGFAKQHNAKNAHETGCQQEHTQVTMTHDHKHIQWVSTGLGPQLSMTRGSSLSQMLEAFGQNCNDEKNGCFRHQPSSLTTSSHMTRHTLHHTSQNHARHGTILYHQQQQCHYPEPVSVQLLAAPIHTEASEAKACQLAIDTHSILLLLPAYGAAKSQASGGGGGVNPTKLDPTTHLQLTWTWVTQVV